MPQCAAHISSFLTDMPKFSAARRIEGWLLCWVPLWELPSAEENHLARGHSPSSGASQIQTVHVLPTTHLPCPNVNGHPSFMGSAGILCRSCYGSVQLCLCPIQCHSFIGMGPQGTPQWTSCMWIQGKLAVGSQLHSWVLLPDQGGSQTLVMQGFNSTYVLGEE